VRSLIVRHIHLILRKKEREEASHMARVRILMRDDGYPMRGGNILLHITEKLMRMSVLGVESRIGNGTGHEVESGIIGIDERGRTVVKKNI
jgi:hypothetical protein